MMGMVSVEVATTKTYVINGLQRNEVWDLVNDEHTQSLYLEDIRIGNFDDEYVQEEIRIVSVMEEE
tara:strand:+ start:349 stop:546 length:198 start_codon:yes stop_codon:yes gene_type:complete